MDGLTAKDVDGIAREHKITVQKTDLPALPLLPDQRQSPPAWTVSSRPLITAISDL